MKKTLTIVLTLVIALNALISCDNATHEWQPEKESGFVQNTVDNLDDALEKDIPPANMEDSASDDWAAFETCKQIHMYDLIQYLSDGAMEELQRVAPELFDSWLALVENEYEVWLPDNYDCARAHIVDVNQFSEDTQIEVTNAMSYLNNDEWLPS